MTVFRLKPIAFFLSCICAYAGAAEDSAIGLSPGVCGLQLKLQPSLIRMPPDTTDPLPIFVDADRIQGHQDRETEAEGAVRLRRRDQSVHADWLRYDQPQDEVSARGNVRLEQRGDVLYGTEMRLKLGTARGALEKPKYEVRVDTTQGRGEGDRILFEGQGKYRVLGGSYTTCDVGSDDWFVHARDFEIDKQRQIGTARDASVVFFGQPILYTPYLSFSLDRQRKSGLLSPSLGTTGNSGHEFSIPYYWNIAPNRDATITPRVMSKRGIQLQNEFRYLEPRYRGEFRYELLAHDAVKNGESRSALSLTHAQAFGNAWNGSLNIQKVSDDTYFTDLSTKIAVTSQFLLPREGVLGRGGTWGKNGNWGFSALVQNWQTLQVDPANPIISPYNRAQLNFVAAKQDIGPTDFELNSSLVNFSHPTLVNGRRLVAYPSLSVPLQASYGYVTPRLGMHLTRYDLDPTPVTATDVNRAVPIFSAESGVVLERNTAFYGQSLLQTLEPKIQYVYIPTRTQNHLPNFDSAQQDVNFATLYSENQFSGNDRINDANQVTMGVTSRLLHRDTGIERLRVGLAQRFYFKSQEVTLPGVPARASASSDLLAALSGTIAPQWNADAGWQYSSDFSQTQKLSAGVRYQPAPGKVVNLGYRFTHDVLRQLDVSSQWPLTGRLSGVARWNYSIHDRRLLEGLAGLEYNAGCWAFRIVVHRFTTAAPHQVSSIFMQLELNGISRIGSNPLELLRRNIAGYQAQQFQSARPDDWYPGR